MARDSIVRRITGVTYLTLALALFVATPMAEARAVAATADVVAHVEAPDASGGCAPVHDHWSCPSCRALRLKPRGEVTLALEVMDARAADSRSEVRERVADLVTRGSTQSRAPPGVVG